MAYTLQLNKKTTITAGITASDLSATLTSAVFTNFSSDYLVIDYDNPTKLEVVKCAVTGTTVTIANRGQEGTSAQSHDAGAKIAYVFVPSHYSDLVTLATTTEADGWQDPAETWSYKDADEITVPAGAVSQYSVGDKLKLNQSVALTSYWNLDGNSTDTKGSNNGTDTDVTWGTGKFEECGEFNGTSSKIVIADATNLKPTGAFTIGLWHKSSTPNMTIFQSYSDNTNANGIIVNTAAVTGYVETSVGNNAASASTTIVGTTNVCDGNWHYIVWSYQGNFSKIFVDGVLDASGYTVTPTYAATNYIRIGCGNVTGTDINFTNGSIDDVFLINGQAVDADWVAAKYAAATAQTNANITMTKYFYVTAVADTALTITGGADYLWSNLTVTDNYYSKVSSPVGFPQWFNHSATAYANDNATALAAGSTKLRFYINGRNISGTIVGSSTTNPDGASIYLASPVSASSVGINRTVGLIRAFSTPTVETGRIAIPSDKLNRLQLLRTADASWSTTENNWSGSFSYEI